MTKKLVTFQSDMRVRAAIESLLKHKISGAPVVDENGNLVGVLSEIDCMSTIIQDLYYSDSGGSVEDFMSTEITTVNSEMGLVDLAEIFQIKHFRRLPVVDNGILVGQVSRRDVLKAIQ
jgi:predicted transcriptional regulator